MLEIIEKLFGNSGSLGNTTSITFPSTLKRIGGCAFRWVFRNNFPLYFEGPAPELGVAVFDDASVEGYIKCYVKREHLSDFQTKWAQYTDYAYNYVNVLEVWE